MSPTRKAPGAASTWPTRPGYILSFARSRAAVPRGLAAWMHAEVADDFAALHQACRDALVRDESLLPFRSRRFSQRERGRTIPLVGVLGSFAVEGDLTALAPFLALSRYAHLGSTRRSAWAASRCTLRHRHDAVRLASE